MIISIDGLYIDFACNYMPDNMPDNIIILRIYSYQIKKSKLKIYMFAGQKAKSVMPDESSNHSELQKLNERNSSSA